MNLGPNVTLQNRLGHYIPNLTWSEAWFFVKQERDWPRSRLDLVDTLALGVFCASQEIYEYWRHPKRER